MQERNGDCRPDLGDDCAIVNNAKRIAEQKGLNVDEVHCPAINSCDGSICIYNGSYEELIDIEGIPVVSPKDTFMDKLRRTVAMQNGNGTINE